uniref:CCHC-type domain-containing protein n=1 Tax=Rhizophagus irregularis (strain DAOM 181602 / DAOM 197198 / MUCL 43194) TaxID=747089 RepID=U9SS16_RHIID
MRSHYQRETVGSRQSALQRLTQEKFLPTDTPDTYEKRIRPLLLGVADGDAQTIGFLKNHLSGNLYTWMRAVAPAGINAFFTNLKDMWLERAPNLNGVKIIRAQPQNNDALEKMYIRAVRLGMPVDAPKDLTSLDNYINDELIRRLGVNNTNYTKLSKKYSQMVNVVKKLAKHKCSNCGKTGHNSRKCPRKKKSKSKKGKVNLATLDSDSGSDTNSDMLSDDSSDSGKKKVKKESSNPSSSLKKKSKSRLTAKSQEVTDIETAFFSKKKKRSSESLSQDNQSRLENIIEKIIEKVLNEKFGDIIAFFQSQNSASRILIDGKDDSTSDTPETPDSGGEDEILNEPMEIDFVQKKDPATDVVTTKCKIKHLVIPGAIVDPGANFLIMTDDISKRSKLEIDTKEKHDLRGIATSPTESLGIVRNVPVNFAPGCTIYADFAVVKYPKPMLILPNTLLDKYNYDLLASKRELKLECNGKEFFIPINMHKVKNKLEVNCATTTSKCDESSTPDCILQDLSEDDDVLKKK